MNNEEGGEDEGGGYGHGTGHTGSAGASSSMLYGGGDDNDPMDVDVGMGMGMGMGGDDSSDDAAEAAAAAAAADLAFAGPPAVQVPTTLPAASAGNGDGGVGGGDVPAPDGATDAAAAAAEAGEELISPAPFADTDAAAAAETAEEEASGKYEGKEAEAMDGVEDITTGAAAAAVAADAYGATGEEAEAGLLGAVPAAAAAPAAAEDEAEAPVAMDVEDAADAAVADAATAETVESPGEENVTTAAAAAATTGTTSPPLPPAPAASEVEVPQAADTADDVGGAVTMATTEVAPYPQDDARDESRDETTTAATATAPGSLPHDDAAVETAVPEGETAPAPAAETETEAGAAIMGEEAGTKDEMVKEDEEEDEVMDMAPPPPPEKSKQPEAAEPTAILAAEPSADAADDAAAAAVADEAAAAAPDDTEAEPTAELQGGTADAAAAASAAPAPDDVKEEAQAAPPAEDEVMAGTEEASGDGDGAKAAPSVSELKKEAEEEGKLKQDLDATATAADVTATTTAGSISKDSAEETAAATETDKEAKAPSPPKEQMPSQPVAKSPPPSPPPPPPQSHTIPSGPSAAGSAAAVASGSGGGPPPQPQMRELKVEDALLYLDQVKLEFGDRPRIYNEFLDIMKNFKAQEIDTPGVIRRVSTLFRGYNNLILGFNTFLPEGYKIELKDLEAGGLAGPPIPSGRPSPPPYGGTGSGRGAMGGGRGFGRGGPGRGGSPYQQGPRGGPSPPQQRQQMQQEPPPQQGGGGGGGSHAVEFDHAIAYVTTIKKRFANDPRTYQTFLEILHTYQKEQRGIKEVLEQVSNLFADHPDLLKEFTFFLPDAVQEQAKERLARAAAEAEERKRIMLQAQAAAQAHLYSGKKGKRKGQAGEYQPPPPPPGTHKFIDMTQPHGKGMSPGQLRKRAFGEPLSPADYVYNAGVERQFFDAAKEALTSYSRDGGQAWAEFLKCLDMYAQEVLSRSEMLGFVEPLLGKRNTELFEEFKRILASAGAPGASLKKNAWYSVPLSEIDFSRCRRCSPSYRALPRDYPAPPCSERSVMEKNILNDVWVSLPVGSEESYTFRHMRKNQHEEILFRVEDERFEIDMCIDSNATALLRLEPIAEEIAQLNTAELISPKFLIATEQPYGTRKGGKDKGDRGDGGVGFGGKRFQYTLDKRILTTIHRHAIVRIYGDAGEEMFDLLFKNPTMAVPVVVKRLRQKDREWKAARDVLNIRWKELAEVNYYKSLDHQSMTWRTTDKRATSTRTLVAEIKDHAANKGDEGEAAISARKDKMKEEYGSFYEVTMGRYLPRKPDMATMPTPSPSLFTPHMTHIYEDCSWSQKDAYRILIYALERGSISPLDKERCHRLWRDFLSHLFGLSLPWVYAPALSYASAPHCAPTVVSNDDDSGEEDEDDDSSNADEGENENDDDDVEDDVDITEEIKGTKSAGEVAVVGDFDGMGFLLDQQPIPVGTLVSTTYGEGLIRNYRKPDGIYEIKLKRGGTAYLRGDSILCTVDPVDKSSLTDQLRKSDSEKLMGVNDRLIIGTQSLYLFFRLHHILVQRLTTAKSLAYKASKDKSIRTHVEQMTGDGTEDIGRKRYDAFLSMVYGLIEGAYSSSQGGSEGGKFDERVRCLLGQGAYELATMDKLINHIQKHLQNLAGDETTQALVDVYRRHADAGSFKPNAFKQEAAYVSEGENMFAFQYCPMPASDSGAMYCEFLGDIAESESSDGGNAEEGEDVGGSSGNADFSEPPTSKRQRRA